MSAIVDENGLLKRLKQQGLDVYAGEFESLRDRLAHTLRANHFGLVIAGRHAGKPETYEQVFARIYGVPLKDCANPARRAAAEAAR